MLPVIEPNAQSTARRLVASAVLLTAVILLPHRIGMAGRIYLMVAVAGGSALLYFGARLARDRTSAPGAPDAACLCFVSADSAGRNAAGCQQRQQID